MKIEAALIDFSRKKSTYDALSKGISEALQASHSAQIPEDLNVWGARMPDIKDWLKLAYEMEREPAGDGYPSESYFVNHEDDVEGYLAENCQHALRAHRLIQERKVARKALGVARRRVTLIANRLAKAQEAP